MLIEVKPNMMVKELKKQFHGYYPNLKIEFFNQSASTAGQNSKDQMLGNEILISSLTGDRQGTIEYSGQTSVRQFETLIAETLQLNVQIFRKSGNVYLETSNTDDWSLDMQHNEALSSMTKEVIPSSDFTDRDQWE